MSSDKKFNSFVTFLTAKRFINNMSKIKSNTVRIAGITALFCLSLACFTYINTLDFPEGAGLSQETYVEEIAPDNPEVLPDVELIKRLVRKAFEFMSKTNLL